MPIVEVTKENVTILKKICRARQAPYLCTKYGWITQEPHCTALLTEIKLEKMLTILVIAVLLIMLIEKPYMCLSPGSLPHGASYLSYYTVQFISYHTVQVQACALSYHTVQVESHLVQVSSHTVQ